MDLGYSHRPQDFTAEMLHCAVGSKKKKKQTFRGMIWERKAGPWERCGEELTAGHRGAGEDRIRCSVGNQFLQPLPRDKKAEL